MRHSPSDNRLSLAEFLAWEAQARIAADSMIAQCVASGDTPGTETAPTFKAQIDRASAPRGETPRRWVAFTVRTLCFISNRRNEQAKYEFARSWKQMDDAWHAQPGQEVRGSKTQPCLLLQLR